MFDTYKCYFFFILALDSGSLYTWGRGSFGRLGLGSNEDQWVPKKVGFQWCIQTLSKGEGRGDKEGNQRGIRSENGWGGPGPATSSSRSPLVLHTTDPTRPLETA